VTAPTDDADVREVTLLLCDSSGTVLGALAPMVARPRFWPEIADVIEQVRERDRLDVVVLRLLTTDGGYAGGRVSYLAQLCSGIPQTLVDPSDSATAAAGADPAHRQWWAEPGGLADLTPWVDAALDAHARRRTGPLRQRKTWNLSLLLSASTDGGDVWVKATPPFLADEGGVVARIAGLDASLVPTVLAHEPTRRLLLMDHIAGADQWGLADERVIDTIVERWVAVQLASVDDTAHLLTLGAADLRAAGLIARVRDAASRPETRATLTTTEGLALDRLLDGLPDRLAQVAACGLPDTVVHGDLHPGNWRGEGDRFTLLDWGDVGVGNPVVDMRAFVERLAGAALQARTRERWVQHWSRAVPGSDAARAAWLMAPVAELAAAAVYQRFLDHIEQTERVYHDHDPVDRFRAAVAVKAAGAAAAGEGAS